jgi:hypothetical protein
MSYDYKILDRIINTGSVVLDYIKKRLYPLRAVKPIDATFSIVDKIDALHDVMVCINTRGMSISEQSEIEQLQVLAESLLNFVITWLSTHPQDDTQALHDAMQGVAQLIRPQTMRNLLGQMTPLQEKYKAFYNQGPASTLSPAGLLLTAAGELPAGSTQTEPANTRRLAKSISVSDRPSAPAVTVPAPTDDRNVDALADLQHVELVLQEIQLTDPLKLI